MNALERAPRPRAWLALAGWIALSLSAGIVGAVASIDARDFYARIAKPAWAPPGSVFGPVWTVLYLLMGTAAWLVWRTVPRTFEALLARRRALMLFVVQLALNALWTWLFFELRRGVLAFVEIVVLWAAIAATMTAFWRVHHKATLLLLPYLAWVSFATALTWAVWRANPGWL